MRKLLVFGAAALLFASVVADEAFAQKRGGGGFGGGFSRGVLEVVADLDLFLVGEASQRRPLAADPYLRTEIDQLLAVELQFFGQRVNANRQVNLPVSPRDGARLGAATGRRMFRYASRNHGYGPPAKPTIERRLS